MVDREGEAIKLDGLSPAEVKQMRDSAEKHAFQVWIIMFFFLNVHGWVIDPLFWFFITVTKSMVSLSTYLPEIHITVNYVGPKNQKNGVKRDI